MEIALAVIAVVGFVGSMPQFWGSSWKNIIQYYYGGTVSWDRVHESALNIINNIENESFSPTVVVGIGRGGILAAGLICSELNKKYFSKLKGNNEIETLPNLKIGVINSKIIFKRKNHNQKSKNSLTPKIEKIEFSNDDLNVEIQKDDKILLLVAQNFTGGSLEKTLSVFVGKGLSRENICTASLFWHKDKKIRCSHDPDIFGSIISHSKTMPWKSKKESTDRY